MEGMSILTMCASTLGILFFMAGCLQLGVYVGATPSIDMAIYLPGLFLSAWPLAVAGVIFALLDVRLQMVLTRSMPAVPVAAEPSARPMSATKVVSRQSAPEGTYFPAQLVPLPPTPYAQQQQAPPPTPEPNSFPQQAPQPAQPSPSEGLSFFKL